ncbi:MAG TPA: HEAT repeat domain-containing protein [Candidatus Baltobacteraceae bacterium]|nr:HEAT repeat domain-containing protein [Candidatus Baltobacteraceae bacterium]
MTIDFRTIVAATAWLAVAIVLLSVLLIVRVSLLRRAAEKREAQLRRFQALWKPILDGPPAHREKLPPVADADVVAWMQLWNFAQEAAYAMGGEQSVKREFLNDIALRKNMAQRALQLLHRREVLERLQAITMLGHLRETSAAMALRELCDSPNALISIAAARALLQTDSLFATRFVAMMAQRADWSAGKIVSIVREERDALTEPLLDHCSTGTPGVTRVLVPYLQYLNARDALPVIRRLIETSGDSETLTSALKVLARIGTPNDAAIAGAVSKHENWRVRVQAANALATLGMESSVTVLAGMLRDTYWWVRYRAAQALGALAGRCNVDLHQILKEQDDRFAREALAQVIAERAPQLEEAAS